MKIGFEKKNEHFLIAIIMVWIRVANYVKKIIKGVFRKNYWSIYKKRKAELICFAHNLKLFGF